MKITKGKGNGEVPKTRGRGRAPIYDFGSLKVSDHLKVTGDDRERHNAACAATMYARRHPPAKFSESTDGDILTITRIK